MADLQALRAANQERMNKLEQDGKQFGIALSPVGLLQLRLDLLTEYVFNDELTRKQFELAWERQLEEVLVAAEQQLAQIRFASKPGLTLPDIRNNKPLGG